MINLKPFNDFAEELYKDFDISKFDKFYLLFEILLSFYERDIDFTSFVEDYIEKNNLDDSEENQLLLIGVLISRYKYLVQEKYLVDFIEDCYDFEIDQDSQVHFLLDFNNKTYRIYLIGTYNYDKPIIYIDETKPKIGIIYKLIGDEMTKGIDNIYVFNKYIS
jgi:hypothetical protein